MRLGHGIDIRYAWSGNICILITHIRYDKMLYENWVIGVKDVFAFSKLCI